jgi:hypothetical protein
MLFRGAGILPAVLQAAMAKRENRRRDAGATGGHPQVFAYVRWNENQRPKVIMPSHRAIENVP